MAYKQDESELRREYEKLIDLGCDQDDIVWCDRARLASVDGLSSKFHCAIYFPNDAVIDSSFYAKTLLNYVSQKSNGRTKFLANSRMEKVTETGSTITVQLESGGVYSAKHIVMSTGALHRHAPLHGIIKPCYSYLVHVPTKEKEPCQTSANFFTWGFTHDWCYTNGNVRISGEDHFSAYKPSKVHERCANLSRWTLQQYGCTIDEKLIASCPQQYGVYSETPDMVPLIGTLGGENSRVCYLLGCNAWGQTILSYCSSLVPGLLGYRELTPVELDAMKLVSIRRFSELPCH